MREDSGPAAIARATIEMFKPYIEVFIFDPVMQCNMCVVPIGIMSLLWMMLRKVLVIL